MTRKCSEKIQNLRLTASHFLHVLSVYIAASLILSPVACAIIFEDNSKWKASLEKCVKEENRDISTCEYLASMEENER